MSRELFVYWHVAGASDAAEAAARQMQDGLRAAHVGLVSRLYRKVGSDRCTLMETYALPGSGIEEALQQQIEAAAAQALAPWCAGGRHVEVFEDCG